jgi:hypothetical protein
MSAHTRRIKFGKFGLAEDPRGQHVLMPNGKRSGEGTYDYALACLRDQREEIERLRDQLTWQENVSATLLEVLEALLAWVEEGRFHELDRDIDKARAAIAQAKGES